MTKTSKSVVTTVKDLIANPCQRILLDDYVTELLKETIQTLSSATFIALPPDIAPTSMQARIRLYEENIADLISAAVILGRWSNVDHLPTLEKIFGRLADANKQNGGIVLWQSMRWYPVFLLSYATGIAALSAQNFHALRSAFFATVASTSAEENRVPTIVRATNEMNNIRDTFKVLPGHERHIVPLSEHAFSLLQQPLDDLLFLGDSYDALFDQFEILMSLEYAYLTKNERGRIWAPPGRFRWKRDAYNGFVREATNLGDSWPPLRVGFFDSSATAFIATAQDYGELLSRSH